MPGGFLGVEVFFVISGFLITSILVTDQRCNGSVSLIEFWKRRALRLLPALIALLVVALAYSAVFLPSEVASLREDTWAAFAYVSNWHLIIDQQSYFETFERPSPLRHLWSLAVEEQFYLVWPLLFAVFFGRLKSEVAAPILLAGAAMSAILMAVLYDPSTDPSRVYYGTDTRIGGLLIGAALAFLWIPGRIPAEVLRATSRTIDLFGAIGLIVVGTMLFSVEETSPFLYRGGFTLTALATAAAIAACVHPASSLGAFLGRQPLRYVGQRSYSIYLWHWPVFVLTRPDVDVALDGIALLVVRFAITFVLAEVSYRLIETPVRTGALGRWWAAARVRYALQGLRPSLRPAGSGIFAVSVGAVLGLAVMSADAPGPPSYLSVTDYQSTTWSRPVAATNQPAATDPGSPSPTQTLISVTSPASTMAPTQPPITAAPTNPPPAEPTAAPIGSSAGSEVAIGVPTSPQPAVLVTGARVFAIGDSVMLGAIGQMQGNIPNLEIDAEVGRQVSSGIEILRNRRDAGLLGDVVVVHLGNNGTFSGDQFDEMMQVLAGVPRVVFVSVKVPRDWEPANNGVIANGVPRYPNAVMVDWHGASADHSELFWDDGIHLRPEGASQFASLVAAPVNAP